MSTTTSEELKRSQFYERVAETYEKNNGGVTNRLGIRMIELASSVPITSSIIHDNASGPGIIAGEILKQPGHAENPPKIHCTDISAPMIAQIEKKSLHATYGVEATVMDAITLSFPDDMFTHSFTNLGVAFMSDPTQAMQHIHRTLKPGGLASVSTIKTYGWLPSFVRAQKRIRPDEEEWKGVLPVEWSTLEHLKELMEAGGFSSENIYAEVCRVEFPMETYLEKQAHMVDLASGIITKTWSDEERAAFGKALEEEVSEEAKHDPSEMLFWIAVAKK